MIKDALERVPTEVWKEALKKTAVAKSRHLNLTGEDGMENRQKLYNYLIGRGFTSSMSSKAVALMKRKQEESLNE